MRLLPPVPANSTSNSVTAKPGVRCELWHLQRRLGWPGACSANMCYGRMQNVFLLLTCSVFVSLKDWPQLQLVNGSGRCSGRVEVFYHGQWGRVCDDHWDMNEADVVCRQLNCGRALAAPVKAQFGEGEGKFLLDDVDCTGRESFLGQCPHSDWSVHNCGPGEDASVVCSGNGRLSLRGCSCH